MQERGSENPFDWFLWFLVAAGQHWYQLGSMGWCFMECYHGHKETRRGKDNSKNHPNSCRLPAAAVQNLWELWKQSAQHQTRRKTSKFHPKGSSGSQGFLCTSEGWMILKVSTKQVKLFSFLFFPLKFWKKTFGCFSSFPLGQEDSPN